MFYFGADADFGDYGCDQADYGWELEQAQPRARERVVAQFGKIGWKQGGYWAGQGVGWHEQRRLEIVAEEDLLTHIHSRLGHGAYHSYGVWY
jgi:hypothetical protein